MLPNELSNARTWLTSHTWFSEACKTSLPHTRPRQEPRQLEQASRIDHCHRLYKLKTQLVRIWGPLIGSEQSFRQELF